MRTGLSKSALRRGWALLLACAPLVALWGCPREGVVCSQGLSACGKDCADLSSDRSNCGGCGVVCQPGQVCQDAQCRCQPGTELCGGACVVTASDPRHCGACGRACASGEVCEAGTCRSNCQGWGITRCGDSCVNLDTDPLNCGSCGRACEGVQSCHQGRCTYDVVAACFSNGQLTGIQAGSDFKGPAEPVGSAPAALATVDDVVLAADGMDNQLYQARLHAEGGRPLEKLPFLVTTGAAPNHVLVDGPLVYVVNAVSGTLQVLRRQGGADAGVGLPLETVGELSFGENTFPEAVAKLGTRLYVPLFGGYGASAAAAGQKVVEVSVDDPAHPEVLRSFDLSAVDLKPFPGGSPMPRPFSIAAHQGALYVALNNLNPDTYAPEGPGMLARIDPVTGAVTTLDLGADRCLNAVWVVSDGERLYVSCQGRAEYSPPTYTLTSVEKTGLVVVDGSGQRQAAWAMACPAGAPPYDPDAGTGCLPAMASRFAVVGQRIYVGDQNGGRVFVLELAGDQLIERRGYTPDGGAPIQACAVGGEVPVSNVSDVLAVP